MTTAASPPSRLAALLLGAALAGLAGCTGGGADTGGGPEQRLAAAKRALDRTPAIRLTLTAEDLPDGVTGLAEATGVGTHQPAFEGTLTVASGSGRLDVEVVAVDGQVHAMLPFTNQFVPVDPAAYRSPDPAALMEPDSGLSSLLTAATGVTGGKQVRRGADVLTEIRGRLAGDVVARIIPSARAGGDFTARFALDDRDRLREAVLSGAFYPGADEVTYTVTFDDYGLDTVVEAP